jgi:dTDP-glucose pyrophosphorylase
LINQQVEEDEMGGACSMNGEKRNAYRLVEKPKGRRPLERPRGM